jgi:hypothetical protein
MKKIRAKIDPVERFMALSDEEKAAELAPFEREEPPLSESRPLNPAERKIWNRQVDAFAKRHKLKRSQMVAEGLRLLMRRRAG